MRRKTHHGMRLEIYYNLSCNRDFDAFDLRMRLPAVLSVLYKAVKRNGGVTYVHCTAGMGRAPAVAVCFRNLLLYYSALFLLYSVNFIAFQEMEQCFSFLLEEI